MIAKPLTGDTKPLDGDTDDEAMTETATDHVDVIETVISSLDQDDSAVVSHTDEGHLWRFKYGSVDVYVQLTGTADTDTLTVWSPVLSLPAQDESGLMRHLLEMNCGETFESCFGILGNQVVVLASRVLQDISPSEISRLMTIVATIADDNDEALRSQFGAAQG
ncbi:YbjN domain-containing protein, putative bacterial sensory transduction regulator [Halomicronema hongdechloris C2206]|uniref:YbjN domain-containing protein, putative bacterial sensory transduction regulator n=1 Tax=Halomicronema hongdechloris C2206 TaxID=1641165 RepID=A0A1Z3HR47_9CYAN|nr:YbjN domain-containing protein [Halomicronema hongdechloris]ASC72781.1 YbjN domain-containing protein, putative bacterial sensory transduction regulator [Halomicronema hongdechloris C2206]